MKTLDEALDTLMKLVGERGIQEAREALRSGETVEGLCTKAHFGLGRHVRNAFKLWADDTADLKQAIWESLPPDRQDFYRRWWNGHFQRRTMHPDDASAELLKALVHRRIV